MAKGEACQHPTCKLCGEAHQRIPGKVCPKFQSAKRVAQPDPLRLAPPAKSKKPPKGKAPA